MFRTLPIPALTLLACLGFGFAPSALAGLNEGEVRTASELEAQTTLLSSEQMSLALVQPVGTALISGTMSSFTLSTSALLSDTPFSVASLSSAAVDFYDTIDLHIPGIPAGTPVRVRIAWAVRGGATSSGSSALVISSRALLSSPSGQTWTRASDNSGEPATFDPDGRVEFDFIVHTDTPVEGNIKLTAAAESIALLDIQNVPSSYNAGPASNLRLSFLQVASITTLNGSALPQWTILSSSLHNYGSGSGTVVPSNPAFHIAPSPRDPHFISFSWQSSPLEFYTVEGSNDLATWTPETKVNGDDSILSLDLIKRGRRRFYRLVTQVGSAPPDATLLNPIPLILPSPLGPNFARIAWMTSIHESYTLQSSSDPAGNWSSAPPQSGSGGAVFKDVPKSGPQHFYRILSGFNELVNP